MNLVAKIPKSRLTLDEYFALTEDSSGVRYDLVDGELRPMSPASFAHSAIQRNALIVISDWLRASASPYRAYPEAAISPHLGAHNNIRVPDVLVTRSRPAAGQLTVNDPVLIVEVLSPTNESETLANVRDYATIPTVQEILLIRSTRIELALFTKGSDGAWPIEPNIVRTTGELRLSPIDFTCLADAFYDGTYLVP